MTFFTNATDNLNLSAPGVVVYTSLTGVFSTQTALSISNGGTGNSGPYTDDGVIYYDNTSMQFASTSAGLLGQVLVSQGNSGTPPSFQSITGSGGISVISMGGTITISGSGFASSFMGNSGTAAPVAGLLNIIGFGPLTTSAAGNTVTISAPGLASTYTANAGSAAPSGGNLNIFGGSGITTSGVGSTITISGSGFASSFMGNSGTATPVGGLINIIGIFGGPLTTSASGNTVTISAPGLASTYTADAGSAAPSGANLNVFGGTGITTSGAGSTITINSVGGGLKWVLATSNMTMLVNTGYVAHSVSQIALALPTVAAFGSVIRVVGDGTNPTNPWIISQSGGQQILFGNLSTTLGAGGSLAATNGRDCVELLCVVANSTFLVLSSIGNITVT